jgi:hypothetical protein
MVKKDLEVPLVEKEPETTAQEVVDEAIKEEGIEPITSPDKIYNKVLHLRIRAASGALGKLMRDLDASPNIEIVKEGTFKTKDGEIVIENPNGEEEVYY